ncbi:MAG TPA: ferritin-like domain-containing protein [Reyranella sp.]|jgi:hypothetical protein|nr:ferritin-like domain-containing protein [Reyranella sp.]
MSTVNKYAIYRHLGIEAHGSPSPEHASVDVVSEEAKLHKRADMTWKDHLVMLLQIGAEIEHSLMVQYLYAAYSLGGDNVPADQQKMVRGWQADILAVAKEEMGHLLTVQNILMLIGAPINLGRMNLPWDIEFYPFPFQLERLSLDSVACYVYAEMPSEKEFAEAPKRSGGQLLGRYQRFEQKDRARIIERVSKRTTKRGAHRVGRLYREIMDLLGNSELIPDQMFEEKTYAFQSSRDDWGRGYQPRPRMLDAEGSLVGEAQAEPGIRRAHVMVDRCATRLQATAALRALSHQGEAPLLATKESDEHSHFDRFLKIYQQFDDLNGRWDPARPVPTNPTTMRDPDAQDDKCYISAQRSQEWASLFNLRYRMLLKYLAHTFQLARTVPGDRPNLRAMVMHRVFGEMYNLKTIAGILVRLPQHDRANDPARAGPPFEIPYTLDLPVGELERWILHRDLISSSRALCEKLLDHPDTEERAYLATLRELDGQTDTWVERIIAGHVGAERMIP